MSDYPLFILFSLPVVLLGYFVFRYPLKVIKFQKAFYYLINWYIEPVSLEKEVRNTKVMGISLILFVLIGYAYIFTK